MPVATLTRAQRETQILDAAASLFYSRGVHEVGMDELVRVTGLGKATVYRMFATKDALVAAYLGRLSSAVLSAIDEDIQRYRQDPATALRAVLAAVQADLGRPGFRGCAFNNASMEFQDPAHPARAVAREYREALRDRLTTLASTMRPGADGMRMGAQLALIIDGMYVSAAHLGPDGPAAAGALLAEELISATDTSTRTSPDLPWSV